MLPKEHRQPERRTYAAISDSIHPGNRIQPVFGKEKRMKRKAFVTAVLIAVLATTTFFVVQAPGKDELIKVREATAEFQHTQTARAAG
jgi:hypothetical protein